MGRIAWRDDAGFAERALLGIEMETRHAVLLIGAMAREAVVGQNRPNLAIEIDAWRWRGEYSPAGEDEQGQKQNRASTEDHEKNAECGAIC